ncbi:hypothetical protein [Pelagicoccus sp. SDUM812002]|uniref:hypothetical protein n=1 Tax=Pelagicoccus sp. SDUM812002 TaxID=3041266 RepID=UPI00280D190A|nr:hypothetical protein [Pelagicoccus sp. SDUM812002]MDQ8184428.1 hypothetical protein [Pelagicoccus sp. SDUM812002]
MGKKTAIGSTLFLALISASYFLYSHFIGFEREPLDHKLPADTYASVSIRHLRKLGIAIATDEQLQASAQVIQGVGKILEASIPSLDLTGEDSEIDEALLLSLSKHFKTQLTIAAIPVSKEANSTIDFALLSDFYGHSVDFAKTLNEISRQATSSTGIDFRWDIRSRKSIPYQTLVPSLSRIDSNLPDIDLSWSVYEDTFYLCSSPSSLEKLLDHALLESSPSTQGLLDKHEISEKVPSADITIFVNALPTLNRLALDLRNDLIASGGLAASFSPQVFLEELGLNRIESFASAIELTGNQSAYSGITYKGSIPLVSAIKAQDESISQPLVTSSIYSYEHLGLDAGESLSQIKNAFLKAAPLANFPYFGLRSKIKRDSGWDFEEVLPNAFEPQTTLLQTFDFGTGRSSFGDIQEQVILDTAIRFKLSSDSRITEIIGSQIPNLLQITSVKANREGNTLYVDRDRDSTVTSNRLALSFDNNYITVGSGTLKSFHIFLEQEYQVQSFTQPEGDEPILVGSGSLVATNLPATLFQLAAVLYQQVNNTPNIPAAFMDFDWSSLTILEQNRISKSYQNEGHLYRVSRQVAE